MPFFQKNHYRSAVLSQGTRDFRIICVRVHSKGLQNYGQSAEAAGGPSWRVILNGSGP
jgi:hypothetical protein